MGFGREKPSVPPGGAKVRRRTGLASDEWLRLATAMTLSAADLDAYRDQGYVLLPGLIDPDRLARLEERFLDLASGRVAPSEGLVIMRDVMVARGVVAPTDPVNGVNKVLSFENDPLLFGYALDDRILGPVRSLLGPALRTISTNVFNKPPEIDGRHPLHQDLRYFSLRPADGIVASWTALSPTTRENGCLSVIPGSHRLGLLPHDKPKWEFINSGFMGAVGAEAEARVHMEMSPGDTLLFHPLLVHGSGRNQTEACRRAISVHYAAQACERPAGPRKREPVMRTIPTPAQ